MLIWYLAIILQVIFGFLLL